MAVNAHAVMAVTVIVNAVVLNVVSEANVRIALRDHLARKARSAARAASAIDQPKVAANAQTK